jgi:DNA (cytosine-5)-methyltransferase 1
VEWGVLSACAMGAPHSRERVFIVAHTAGRHRWPTPHGSTGALPQAAGARHSRFALTEPGHGGWWDTEPGVARVANGVPAGVDRRRSLGNAVVPQVGEYIGRLVMAGDLAPLLTPGETR